MSPWLVVVLKAVAGGLLVCAFALVGEVTGPRRFSGLFCAAPSVAIASLAVTQLAKGASDVKLAGLGMIAGGVAFVAYTVATAPAVRRFGALVGTSASVFVWVTVAAAGLAVIR